MKIPSLFRVLLTVLTLSSFNLHAQESSGYCGFRNPEEIILERTDLTSKQKTQRINEFREQQELLKKKSAQLYAERHSKSNDTLIIPVVVHILHNYGPENIGDDQVYNAIANLNEEFNKQNDQSNLVAPFNTYAGNAQFVFRLAKLDPNGQCTNGIVRHVEPNCYFTEDTAAAYSIVRQYIWPHDQYMNIFVCGSVAPGIAGRSIFPGAIPGYDIPDCTFMRYSCIGSIGESDLLHKSVLTHETGHWFSLWHTWGKLTAAVGANASCNDDDDVPDTPNNAGTQTCTLNLNSCDSGVPGDTIDNVQNFMDYAYCYQNFTEGQVARMRAATLVYPERYNLWQPANLVATGVDYPFGSEPLALCKAQFSASDIVVCEGETIDFTDESFDNITSRTWTFTGGTPPTSTAANPAVTYNTAGTYSVSLTVSDGNGSLSHTETNYITVLPESTLPVPYLQPFTSLNGLEPEFVVTNYNTAPTWELSTTVGVDDTKCAVLHNEDCDTMGRVDELISQTMDLSNVSGSPVLRFRYAFAAKDTTNTDMLYVYVSKNCGVTWTKRKTLSAAAGTLQTAPDLSTGTFVPDATQWVAAQVSLTGFDFPAVRYRFQFISGGGNAVYLDNINVGNQTVGLDETTPLELTLAPNPTTGIVNIESDELLTNARIRVFDLSGKLLQETRVNTENTSCELNLSQVAAGMCIVEVTTARGTAQMRVVKE